MPTNCWRTMTRSCLMVVLQGVMSIQIAPKLSSQSIKFDEVLLDKISNTPGVSQAISVERCQCPKEYTSSSCQDPNTGYYRHYPTPEETNNYIDRMLGMARPCQCNGRSDLCDKQTGHCHNCTDFTTGPHCEFCAEGYYKDVSGKCAPCLCPSETQNFAKNCTVSLQRQSHYVCHCKEGYSGAKCNDCEDGYWGNPHQEGGSCKPCNCNPFGSEDYRCDKNTGRCRCKLGFTGGKCADCTSPRQVIQDGICTPCDECTQILFYTLDNLSEGLNKTLDLFKNGLGPPWGLLNSTLFQYNLLAKRFNNIDRASIFIEQTDLQELENRIDAIQRELPKRNTVIETQKKQIENIQKNTYNITQTVEDLSRKVDDLIDKLKDFGKSHIDVNEALREAKNILVDITRITNEAPSPKDYEQFFRECEDVLETINEIYSNGNLNPNEIKAKLNELKKRLRSLNVLLNQTDAIVKLTKIKNKQNAFRIAELNRTINEINLKNSIVNDNVSAILKKIEATNDLLLDIKAIYELLKMVNLQNLTKRLNVDEDLQDLYSTLSSVSQHVKNLQNKIKAYKRLFNFTDEEWKKIDASGAYENLIKGIEEAGRIANEARNITIDTLRKLYPPDDDSLLDKANLAETFSDRLEKRVKNLKNLTKDYRETAEELEKLKHEILFNGKNNNELNSVLRSIRQKIAEQGDNLAELEKAKENARNVSELIAAIEKGLKDTNITMQYELIKTYYKYLDLVSKDEISKITDKINLTKKELKEINIYLNFTKFDQVRDANANKFNNTEQHLGSIQNLVDELKNKIRYATERAESIEYGLKLSNCQRYYTVPNDIFRSLDISFKCTSCILFNLTNSKDEVISVFVENNTVHVKWKNQNKQFGNTNKISLRRIGVTIRIETEDSTTPVDISDSTLFQIEENYPFQVGDVKNATDACLQKLVLNGQTIGLWKFNRSKGDCSGCNRNISNDGLEDVFFNGKGYRNRIDTKALKPNSLDFTFIFETFDENSLLFIAQDTTNHCSYIALNLVKGNLQFKMRHNKGEQVTLTSKRKYNNGNITTAQVSLNYNEGVQVYSLEVFTPEVEKKITKERALERNNVYKIKKSDIFVGGVSSIFNRSCLMVDTTPFLGNLKVIGSVTITGQNTLSYNIEPRVEQLGFDKAWFTGEGHVSLQTEKRPQILTFSLRPVNVNNSFVMNIHNLVDIYLENSSLRVKTQNEDILVGCFSVNATHLININETSVEVNNDIKNFTNPLKFPNEPINLYLGSDQSKKYPNYTGSIFDIFDNNGAILFNKFTVKGFSKVKIGRDEPASHLVENKCIKEMQNTQQYPNKIPAYKTASQAFKFGDQENSFILIKNSFMGKKYVLEFEFRTLYPSGLLFVSNPYDVDRNRTPYVYLGVHDGKLRLRVEGHRPKILDIGANKKINDGAWHFVHFEQIPGKKKWRLLVKLDKKWKLKDRLPKNTFKWDLHVGGMSGDSFVYKKLEKESRTFYGCIRSLKINKNLQTVKNNKNVFYNNIGQCFENVEKGAYFGGDAFAIYKNDFEVNRHLELSFEFKTSEPNGILLSVSNVGNSPALSVELQNGAVVMTIDMGNGVISKVTNNPPSNSTLANNKWHILTALYSSSELTVNVDGVRKSWVKSEVNSLIDKIKAPLYVGGLPSNAPSGTLKIKENFKGCIRKFQIGDVILDWTDMKERNNVQLNSCLA